MNYGAVIVAAGLSSRMGEFKPLLQIGSQSVVRHVISAFSQAGIRQIAIVTGHNASALTEHLADLDVTFLHNEHYRTTQMFDSAKIGLSHWKETCDRVLFTPVDIPLFSSSTVLKLIASGAELASPLCSGKQGHPLMLSSRLIDAILKDSGEGGLKGAVARLNIPMTHVEVDDPGVLQDADTPEEFQKLLKLHRLSSPLYPSDEKITQLLNQNDTPDPVRAHCAAVAEKAEFLAARINRPYDPDLLRAACLLHDIARASGKNHAAAGAEIILQAGYPLLAEIVGQHHDLKHPASIEAQLLYLADKLVQETREVTLQERFSASRKKCTTPESMECWQRRYHDALRIAKLCRLPEDENGGTP